MKTFLFLAALTAPLLGADDYELRMSRPSKVGDKEVRTGKYMENSKVGVNVDGNPVKADKTEIDVEYETQTEVLAVTAAGRPSSLKFKMVKVSGTMNGKPLSQLAVGDQIVVSRKTDEAGKDTRSITVNDAPASKDQTALVTGFSGIAPRGDISDDDVFGTTKRIKLGDEWKINGEKAAGKFAESGFQGVDASGVKGSAKLHEVAKVDGVPCLRVSGVYEIKGAGMPMPNVPPGVKVTQMVTKVSTEGNFPVDVNDTAFRSGVMQMEMEMVASGEIDNKGQKAKLDVAMAAKRARMETCKRLPSGPE